MGSPIRVAAKTVFSLIDIPLGRFPGPRILIYHQIGAGNGKQMDLATDHFRRHIDILTGSDFAVVSLDEAIAARSEPESDRYVVLTFDDGYDDMYRNAYPLLEDRQLPFTVYLTSNPIEARSPLSEGGRSTPITWDDVNTMQESGLVTVGAHTHTHPDFRTLDSAQAEEEIGISNDLIARRTGIRPEHFAYPWGYWSSACDRAVRDTYSSATLGGGKPVDASSDPLLINRIPVQLDDGVTFFSRKLHKGQRTEEYVRRRLAKYDGP